MYIYRYKYIYIYTYIHIYICKNLHTCVHVSVCVCEKEGLGGFGKGTDGGGQTSTESVSNRGCSIERER